MVSSRLEKHYNTVSTPQLKKHFDFKNDMQVPKLKKISINISVKDAVNDSKIIDKIYEELMVISGQKPVVTKAKKSIAGFKLRQGMKIGCKVTLRKTMMYEFLDRLINIALPRVRDFKGLSFKQFDGNGNFCLGIKEQIVFPEIDYNKIDKIRGMNIVIVTSTNSNEEAKFLLKTFNLPFYN
ncbi:50S ribosomal protein L5 [Candidatus Aquarickettsia rohweri]|uniref:Large ribosomal subunit protein uL5 n=1 Tax=Candidatus Aquarickettsia rohweri TaxID=2602574 RepID=A0A429XNP4_9RICK|nr:50S ribosomal protein L5 [Candidatus Aquarickettsia rohweri]MSO13357.1 50S ribosomal protein L5 [Rickettsiales endosymbiont of Trichoplax sp. H2]RST68181.1 50S ribosomal protein L5 [Candidatus Aquarickettsia rohweri]